MSRKKQMLSAIVAVTFALVLFLTCGQRNEIFTPTDKGSMCYAFLCDTVISAITQIGDTVHFSTCDTIHTADSITLVGIIYPPSNKISKTYWTISDGTSSDKSICRKKFDKGGVYQSVFTMVDNAGLSTSDTVVVCVYTPQSKPVLLSPLDSNAKVNPENDLTFLWSCNNPDKDSLVYKLYFDTLKSLSTPSFVPAIIHDSSIVIKSQYLTALKKYYWYVKAINQYHDTMSSDTFWFRTKDPNATTGTCAGYACLQGVGHHSGIKILFQLQGGISLSYSFFTNDNGFYTSNTLFPGTYSVTTTDTLRNAFQSASRTATITLGDSVFLDTMLLLDVKKPVIAVTYPIAGDTLKNLSTRSPLFNGTLCDTGSQIRQDSVKIFLNGVRVGSPAVTQAAWSFTPTNIADGRYSLVINAKDSAGNAANQVTQNFFVNSKTITASVNQNHVSINDSMTFSVSLGNVNPPVKTYYWNFNSLAKSTWDDSAFTSASSVTHKWAFSDSISLGRMLVKAVDDSGMVILDTVSYIVYQDVPVIAFLSPDTIVDHSGTVRCSVYVQQQFGTMTVEIDTANSGVYKSIGSFGLAGGTAYSFTTGTACSWDSVKVRITDDDGNVVIKGFKVRIRPRPLTITSIDSTVNTITVHYSQSQETDFNQYRIYRNTTSSVDTTSELWTTISASGTVSYTTTPTSYAWNPRFYKVYQKDNEGLWSAGSNVVYGCIVNSPPSVPVITYPANNGDTLWPEGKVYWHTCIDPNGNGVRYKVLVNYNNIGYSQLATGITDTFVQLTGYDSLGFKVKVIAYDTLGDSSAWSAERNAVISCKPVTDIDGNVYHTVKIGNQFWTVENLRTTKYNDGSSIKNIKDSIMWSIDDSTRYCYYNNTTNADSISKFGALYNWYAVNTGKLAPAGWHVPTDAEWEVMQSYLVMHGYNYDGTTDTTNNKIAMALAAQTDWQAFTGAGFPGNNLTQNNSSGFSALPGGYRYGNGSFISIGSYGYWWSATEGNASYAWNRDLSYDNYDLSRGSYSKSCGFSVRLVRDP